MCVIEIESAVIPSSVASGASSGSSVAGSQNVSILANRLVRSTSSSVMSPSGTPVVVSFPPPFDPTRPSSSSPPLEHASEPEPTATHNASNRRTDERNPGSARTTFPLHVIPAGVTWASCKHRLPAEASSSGRPGRSCGQTGLRPG